jgi:hypothetical protein
MNTWLHDKDTDKLHSIGKIAEKRHEIPSEEEDGEPTITIVTVEEQCAVKAELLGIVDYDILDDAGAGLVRPEPTDAEKIASMRQALDKHLDKTAQSIPPFGFDDMKSAVLYADYMEDTFNQPHGFALRAYRNECQAYARQALGAWQAGGVELTEAEFIAGIPKYVGV